MARAATNRLKVNPPLGSLPVLQYCPLEQLAIDDRYQRSLEGDKSRALIRKIAVYWDWGLCQPLFVARRQDGALYVVDGQHRLAAGRLRGDIWQLPCVVTSFSSAEEEAASFVALNQQRRPLNKLELFKAALAAGDFESAQILKSLEDAGLKLSNHASNSMMKPGHVCNIGGLQRCYRVHGLQVLNASLLTLAKAYPGLILRYAGTIFPGIEAVVAAEIERDSGFVNGEMFALLSEMVGGATQAEWAAEIHATSSSGGSDTRRHAAAAVFSTAWSECTEAMLEDAA